MGERNPIVKIITIIPALNEEKGIGQIVRQIHIHNPDIKVLVIDDGSTDNTAHKARSAGAEVITLPFNLGIGGAVQTGYLYAYQFDYDIAVQIDADGQHLPSELDKIVQPICKDEADIVVGSRFVRKTSYRSTKGRRAGIFLLSALVRALTGKKIDDVTSGFRAVNKSVIAIFASDYSTDYPEVDSYILLRNKGKRILEVPVEMNARQHGKSSITHIRSVYYMIKVSISLIMRAMSDERKGRPL